MESWTSLLAPWSGWIALAVILLAGVVPLAVRARQGHRSAPGARPIRIHVILGVAATSAAALHTLLALPALGNAAVVSVGALGLAPAALAFLIIVAHVGLGLQLRDPKLKRRPSKRRAHQMTALSIVALVVLHAVMLLRGSSP